MKLNFWGILSLIYLGMFITLTISDIGEVPEIKTEPYTVFNMMVVFFALVGIWLLGYLSKFKKQ